MSSVPEALRKELEKLEDLHGTGFIQLEEYKERKAALYRSYGLPNPDEGSSSGGGSNVDPFSTNYNNSDPFGNSYNNLNSSDPFATPYNNDPFSTPYNNTTSDPFGNSYNNLNSSDPFNSSNPSSYTNDPFATPYNNPISSDPVATPYNSDPYSTPYSNTTTDPYSTPSYTSDPFATPYNNPTTPDPFDIVPEPAPYEDPFSTTATPPPPPAPTTYTRYNEPVQVLPTPPPPPTPYTTTATPPPPPTPYTTTATPPPPPAPTTYTRYNEPPAPLPIPTYNTYNNYDDYDRGYGSSYDSEPVVVQEEEPRPKKDLTEDPEAIKIYMADWHKKNEAFKAGPWRKWNEWKQNRDEQVRNDPISSGSDPLITTEYEKFDPKGAVIVYVKDRRGLFQSSLPVGSMLCDIGSRFGISHPILVKVGTNDQVRHTDNGERIPEGQYILKQKVLMPHRSRPVMITGQVLEWFKPPEGHSLEAVPEYSWGGYGSYQNSDQNSLTADQAAATTTGYYRHSFTPISYRGDGFGGSGMSSWGFATMPTDIPTGVVNWAEYKKGHSKLEEMLKLRAEFDRDLCKEGKKYYYGGLNIDSTARKWLQRIKPWKLELERNEEWKEFERKRQEREDTWRKTRYTERPPEAEGDRSHEAWAISTYMDTHDGARPPITPSSRDTPQGCVLENEPESMEDVEKNQSEEERQQLNEIRRTFPWLDTAIVGTGCCSEGVGGLSKHDMHGDRYSYLSPASSYTSSERPLFVRRKGAVTTYSPLVKELAMKLMPGATVIEPPPRARDYDDEQPQQQEYQYQDGGDYSYDEEPCYDEGEDMGGLFG